MKLSVPVLFFFSLLSATSWAACSNKLALQILGSGGPVADDDRASSGYLLWVDGHAKLLVDAGGGVFQRFGEAGADITDLDAVVLTHFHADHSAELPALLKSGYFSERKRELPVIGPTGEGVWPGASDFMRALFAPKQGAFAYLAGYLDGSDGLFHTPVTEVDAGSRHPAVVLDREGIRVSVVGVKHGPVPALGVLIEAGGKRIAISGDQNGDNPHYTEMIKGAEVLVVDYAIPPSAGEVARNLHLTPAQIGTLAATAGVGRLVLSHLMKRSLDRLDDSKAIIAESYPGPIAVAEDLMCIELGVGRSTAPASVKVR